MDRTNLVITRAVGESVDVGSVTFTIISNKCGQIRIGIRAPRGMPISRDDVKKGAKVQCTDSDA